MDVLTTGLFRKLRVAIINNPLEQKYHSYGDHWVDGFEDAGCDVTVYPYENIKTLPLGFDLYFFVEVRYNPAMIPWHVSPRVMYSWDSHILGTEYYQPISKRFDTIYLASKIDAEKLVEIGCPNVRWLPEACNPRIHKDLGCERSIDVGFVGRGNHNRKRKGLSKDDFLLWLKEKSSFRTLIDHDRWGESYSEIMNSSKIAFDRVIAHNVGTRVFEAAAFGCVPLWAESGIRKECGMEELMEPGKHYVPYEDTIEGLEKVISGLLENKERLSVIAKQAREYVGANHTYAHRARTVLTEHIPNFMEWRRL